jgi:hypothetical protein
VSWLVDHWWIIPCCFVAALLVLAQCMIHRRRLRLTGKLGKALDRILNPPGRHKE